MTLKALFPWLLLTLAASAFAGGHDPVELVPLDVDNTPYPGATVFTWTDAECRLQKDDLLFVRLKGKTPKEGMLQISVSGLKEKSPEVRAIVTDENGLKWKIDTARSKKSRCEGELTAARFDGDVLKSVEIRLHCESLFSDRVPQPWVVGYETRKKTPIVCDTIAPPEPVSP